MALTAFGYIDDEQQRQLMLVLLECKSHIVISGYDNSLMNQYLTSWKFIKFKEEILPSSLEHRRKMAECLWINR